MKVNKTNAARLLDAEGVHYELIPYEVDESDLSAVHVAESLGQEVDRLFKTILLRGDKSGHFVCLIPGDKEIDLKIAAKVSGNKKCELLPLKELLSTTGYQRGACSPIGMKHLFPTYIDQHCQAYDTIYVSAGKRGIQLKIDPNALIMLTKAKVCLLFDSKTD